MYDSAGKMGDADVTCWMVTAMKETTSSNFIKAHRKCEKETLKKNPINNPPV